MAENSKKRPDELYKMRHSLAHILAYAVKNTYKDVKFGVGPVIENGFFYDFDLPETISEDDLTKIEKQMREIIKKDYRFEHEDVGLKEAKDRMKKQAQPYKMELVNDIIAKGSTDVYAEEGGNTERVDKVGFYKIGEFNDLCRGGHVESTGKVGAFKLIRVSGAYWRGDEKNPQMQRIYGVAFKADKELKDYLNRMDEAKKRDHRRLGKELDLFVFSPLVGSGLPLFTPKGTLLRNLLGEYSKELKKRLGFQEVWIPHVAKQELYKTSGHWDKFGDELFLIKSQETSDELVLKPMNCPHHIQIYASHPRSYRDLPVQYMENTTIYRDEKTGELHGIERVRSVTQDDCHTFCSEGQVSESVSGLVDAISELYKVVGMPITRIHLSFRDEGDGYLGSMKLWQQAQSTLEDIAKENGLKYVVDEGEAAFYGPKIDFIAADAIGRETQVATIQLDFVQPERFGLSYTDSDGKEKQPVMIHSALLGSVERFLSVYIEHTGGKFPVWLAPEQIRIATVNQEDQIVKFAKDVLEQAKRLGLRAKIDDSNESVGKKIRNAEVLKVPYTVVIGEKEAKTGQVSPRVRKDLTTKAEHKPVSVEEFLKIVVHEAKSRAHKTSL